MLVKYASYRILTINCTLAILLSGPRECLGVASEHHHPVGTPDYIHSCVRMHPIQMQYIRVY
jgi:hypothetical protein